MPNSTSPFGFRSFGHRDGSAPTMGLERLWIFSSNAHAMFTGDLIQRSCTVGVDIITVGTTCATPPVGVFAGCEYYNTAVGRVTWSSYFPGSVGSSSPVTVYAITDPEMQFLGVSQSTAAISSADVGNTISIATSFSSLGNTTTGQSAMWLSSAVTSLASAHFKIVDLYSNFGPPGAPGTDNTVPYNILVVTPNTWDRKAGTGGLST